MIEKSKESHTGKKRYMMTLIAGIAILLAGMFLAAFAPYGDKILNSGIITGAMVMIVLSVVFMLRRRDGPAKDELTRKIADRSAAYSWVITILALMGVFWLNHFGAVAFTVDGVITITYLVMVASMVLFQRIFWSRGDVE